MQLTIKANNEKGIEEWFMIELQGDLETTGDETTLQGSHMGYLLFTKKEEPILIIGHHVLYGSTAKLSKPMAVLVKKSNSSTIVDSNLIEDQKPAYFECTAIVYRKLLFKNRPKPYVIMNNNVKK